MGGNHTGNYYEPTVVTGVTPDMRIYNEESFGPVVSVIPAKDSERIFEDCQRHGLWPVCGTDHSMTCKKLWDMSLRLESGYGACE